MPRDVVAIRIEQLTPEQIPEARNVIRAGCLEFFGHEPAAFEDMDAPLVEYGPPSGTFLVLLDGEAVVGTGAIRRLEDEVCELKRMWFLPPYRGKGYGWQMSERLLAFARSTGYARMRLDSAPQLKAAARLYARLGFRPVGRYNSGPGSIFLEKDLRE